MFERSHTFDLVSHEQSGLPFNTCFYASFGPFFPNDRVGFETYPRHSLLCLFMYPAISSGFQSSLSFSTTKVCSSGYSLIFDHSNFLMRFRSLALALALTGLYSPLVLLWRIS